ncbi:PAS domain S-box protein [Verrucomicrobia bacterium S94]|nr:PAS domain S-box protein [Verrucomicrobia bacterium S94]
MMPSGRSIMQLPLIHGRSVDSILSGMATSEREKRENFRFLCPSTRLFPALLLSGLCVCYPLGAKAYSIQKHTISQAGYHEANKFLDEWFSVPLYLQISAAEPFESHAETTFGEYISGHRLWLPLLSAIILLLSTSILIVFYLNRRLRINRARLDLALSAGGIGVWDLDLEKDRLIWDDRMFEIFGVDRKDFDETYSSGLKYLHPADLEKSSREFIDRCNSNESFKTSYRIKRPDGQVRHIAVYGKVVESARGKAQRVIGCNQDITDRLRNEQALDSFFEQSTNLHLIAGLDGTIQRMNTGWEAVLGQTTEELEGSRFFDLVHPDDLDATVHEMIRLSAGESVDRFENRYRHSNGEYRTIEWASVATAEDGLVFAAAKDITDRKRAEQLAQAALDALSANIAILDHEGRFLAVNRMWKSFAEKNGSAPESYAVGSSYLSFCKAAVGDDAEEANRFADGLQSVLSGETSSFSMEYSFVLEEELVWFVVNVTAFPEEDDSRIVVAHTDITARKRAEFAEKESQERYRALYENAPICYQSLREDGTILDVNPAWLRHLGYEHEEVVEKWFGDFLHPDSLPDFKANFSKFKGCGHIDGIDYLVLHKAGNVCRIRIEGCIGYHPDGRFKQTYCVFQDITEQYEAIEALRRSEQEFRMLAETLPLGIYFSRTEDQVCDYLNPAFTEITGYTMAEVPAVDKVFQKIYPDAEYRDSVRDEWRRRVAASDESGQGVEPLETEVTRKDGSSRTVEWGQVRVGGKEYIFGRDLTEQKKARSAMEEYTRSLERFNRASTGRELRMVELKEEINSLRRKLGQDEIYTICKRK